MIRVLAVFLVLALASIGAVWLADNPGLVTVVWLGKETKLSIGVALAAIFLMLIALGALFALVRFILRAPGLITRGSQRRREEKGLAALSRGLVAVGAGDSVAARRHAQDARRFIAGHPLSLLLDAQSAQLHGDRAGARRAFEAMTRNEQSRLLGLRGLFIEARRAGDDEAARDAAGEAVRIAPSAAWANEALLTGRIALGDWAGARQALERAERLRVLDRTTSRRQRAVLLTAEAQEMAEVDPAQALTLAREACDLAPDLVPATALAARLLGERGDLKKASRLIESAWKGAPHPDLAEVYADLRSGDSALDRLHRAQALARLVPGDEESAFAVARAAVDARELDVARQALAPLVGEQPTVRACLLMADIAELDGSDDGATRYWLARAARAARDKAWVADGIESDRWLPASPATGRLDAFVWASPPERLTRDQHHARTIADALPAIPSAAATVEGSDEGANAVVVTETPTAPPAQESNAPPPTSAVSPAARPTPVIFPVARAPDDPGAAEMIQTSSRWRVFNG